VAAVEHVSTDYNRWARRVTNRKRGWHEVWIACGVMSWVMTWVVTWMHASCMSPPGGWVHWRLLLSEIRISRLSFFN